MLGRDLGPFVAAKLDRAVGESKRRGNVVDDRVQDIPGIGRVLEPVAEPGKGCVGVRAVAINESADASLHGDAEWLEPERDNPRCDDPGDAAGGNEPIDEQKQPEIAPDDAAGEGSVDERAAEDQLDVEQVVAEHGDPDRGRNDRHGSNQDGRGGGAAAASADGALDDASDDDEGDQQRPVGEPQQLQPLVPLSPP